MYLLQHSITVIPVLSHILQVPPQATVSPPSLLKWKPGIPPLPSLSFYSFACFPTFLFNLHFIFAFINVSLSFWCHKFSYSQFAEMCHQLLFSLIHLLFSCNSFLYFLLTCSVFVYSPNLTQRALKYICQIERTV